MEKHGAAAPKGRAYGDSAERKDSAIGFLLPGLSANSVLVYFRAIRPTQCGECKNTGFANEPI
jgi:hypothetical protein